MSCRHVLDERISRTKSGSLPSSQVTKDCLWRFGRAEDHVHVRRHHAAHGLALVVEHDLAVVVDLQVVEEHVPLHGDVAAPGVVIPQPVEGVAERVALEVTVRQRQTVVEGQFGFRWQVPCRVDARDARRLSVGGFRHGVAPFHCTAGSKIHCLRHARTLPQGSWRRYARRGYVTAITADAASDIVVATRTTNSATRSDDGRSTAARIASHSRSATEVSAPGPSNQGPGA